MRVALRVVTGLVLVAGSAQAAQPAPPDPVTAPAAAASTAPAASTPDTRSRYLALADRQFQRLDANADGAITKDEVDAAAERIAQRIRARMARQFAGADADGDGKETQAEYRAVARQRFERLDASDRGKASLDRVLARSDRTDQP